MPDTEKLPAQHLSMEFYDYYKSHFRFRVILADCKSATQLI